jgi:hypothetical protein
MLGQKNWVYSMNLETQEVEPGLITWAAVTRRDAELVRITLDNLATIDATPDHRFILASGEDRQAGDLQPGDSLMSMNRHTNHKVISVEPLAYREDTGDITVESPSGSHVFALAAGIYVHNSADGRGSKVETLPGGELTGEIGDLMFFSRKLARGLRIPTSYLNLGEEEGQSTVNFQDGKLGAALIQEYRFSKFCMRLQSLLAPTLDREFKRFLQKNGIELEWSLFRLQFTEPQSFTKYRQMELDSQRVQIYSSVAENKILAQRTKLKRYLGFTDDEVIENEKAWAEENAAKLKKKTGATPAETEAQAGLGDIGLHGGDMEAPPEELPPEDEMAAGGPGAPGAMPGGAGAGAGTAPAGGGGMAAAGAAAPMPGM